MSYLDNRFARLDLDRNGTVSYGEWQYAGKNFESQRGNNDGKLNFNEFLRFAQNLVGPRPLDYQAVKALFDKLDTTKDGQITISPTMGEAMTTGSEFDQLFKSFSTMHGLPHNGYHVNNTMTKEQMASMLDQLGRLDWLYKML